MGPSRSCCAGRVVSVHQQGGTGSFDLNLRDEYDPAKPNDYEEIRRQREQQRISAEQVAQQQEALRAQLVAQEVMSVFRKVFVRQQLHARVRAEQGGPEATSCRAQKVGAMSCHMSVGLRLHVRVRTGGKTEAGCTAAGGAGAAAGRRSGR